MIQVWPIGLAKIAEGNLILESMKQEHNISQRLVITGGVTLKFLVNSVNTSEWGSQWQCLYQTISWARPQPCSLIPQFLWFPASVLSLVLYSSGLELSNILPIHLFLPKLARVGLHCLLLRNLSSSPCKGPFSVAPSLSSLQDLKLNPVPHEMSLMLSLVTIGFLNILLSLSLLLLYHPPSLCPGSSFLSLRCFQ